MNKPWRVVVHLSTTNKIEYTIGPRDMANEYATFILQRGCHVIDDRGVITWFPVHMIHKVKIVPPNVKLGSAMETARFISSKAKEKS